MKLIIAGTRSLNISSQLVEQLCLDFKIWPSVVLSGGASGVDKAGELFAKQCGVPLKVFKADWDTLGKSAGPMRNIKMSKHADALLVIWDGCSRGSLHMKHTMLKLKKPIYEVTMKETL